MRESGEPPPAVGQAQADLRLEVSGEARAVTAARRAVAGLDTYLEADATKAVLLLVSELVTNAILHGGADATSGLSLELKVAPRTVRVEVRDPGDGFPLEPTKDPDRDGGWGLLLLERLADRWGIESAPQHTIWFEIDRPLESGGQTPDPSDS
jgi:anti-sigma regulatory factor (Ser/Thr protein kinase)